jgi:hypothetical protein
MADTYIVLGDPQGGNHAPKETLPLAKAAATRAVELDPLLGEAHFVLAQTLELYDWNWSEAEQRSRQHYISNSLFAEADIGLGKKDEAMSWLERAYEEHDQWMVYIKSYPGWDALRSEPRFQDLVRRMNFPQ